MNVHRYAWPASAISTAEMAALYRAREASSPKVPISKLIARAIHQVYSGADATRVPDTIDTPSSDPATHGLGEAAA